MADFEVEPIGGLPASLYRARLYAPDGDTVTDLALTETAVNGVYSTYAGTVAFTPPDPYGVYTYEIRKVTAQTAGAFDASTDVLLPPGDYREMAAGEWDGDATAYEGRYTTSEKLRTFLGTLNADAHADTDGDDDADAGAYAQAIRWAEAKLDFRALGPFEATADSVGETTLEETATSYAAKKLIAKRVLSDEMQDRLDRWLKDADDTCVRMAIGQLPEGVTRTATASTAVNYPVVADGSAQTVGVTAYPVCPNW